jgi:lipopolysaccharide/colanic/teichoic acid biosynthesis glycosyltransferase
MPLRSVVITKRVFDVTAAGLGLALVLPTFPFIALAIKLDSPGPILYRQRRAAGIMDRPDGSVGFKEFEILKFRTMGTDAEKKTGAVMSQKNDARVTRVGRFLRATRLDELPQFINILRGDMSLIGPRPERPEMMEKLMAVIPYFEERLRGVKPGLTGLAQIRLSYTGAIPKGSELEPFRDALQNPYKLEEAEGALADDLRAKLAYDLAYAAAMEHLPTFLRLELEIIFKTPWVMLRGTKY